MSLLLDVRPIVRATTGATPVPWGTPSPGSVCSTVPLSTPALLDRLSRRESDESIIRHIL